MAWDNREYYRDGANKAEYLGNPALFLSMSTNFGTWFGVPIRLSFWLILMLLMHYVTALHGVSSSLIAITALMFVGALIVHDFGHRFFAHRVGGTLESFLLWPFGGLNFPAVSPDASSTLWGYGGGILAHLAVGGTALAALAPLQGFEVLRHFPVNPVRFPIGGIPLEDVFTIQGILREIVLINGLLILCNLLPFYWFDGGHLAEAALRPWLGMSWAIRVTCIAGMCLAPIGLLYAVDDRSLVDIVFWAFLFASSFNKYRSTGGAYGESVDTFAYAAAYETREPTAARRKPRWASRKAMKKVAAARQEQEKIDEILAKVHAQGMQSLNWMERRALRKATERQRGK